MLPSSAPHPGVRPHDPSPVEHNKVRQIEVPS